MRVSSLHAFDLDHTLLRGNSSFLFSRHLYRRGIFTASDQLYCLAQYVRYRFGRLRLQQMHTQSFLRLFYQKPQKLILDEVAPFWERHFPQKCNSFLLSRITHLQAEGAICLLVSSSPAFLVAPIAARLQLCGCLATEYGIDKLERFCHIAELIDGSAKARFVARLAKQWNINREQTWAYSDSIEDLPLLESVGHPVLVQPDRHLKAIGKQRQWPEMGN